jgi:hypothetical protein
VQPCRCCLKPPESVAGHDINIISWVVCDRQQLSGWLWLMGQFGKSGPATHHLVKAHKFRLTKPIPSQLSNTSAFRHPFCTCSPSNMHPSPQCPFPHPCNPPHPLPPPPPTPSHMRPDQGHEHHTVQHSLQQGLTIICMAQASFTSSATYSLPHPLTTLPPTLHCSTLPSPPFSSPRPPPPPTATTPSHMRPDQRHQHHTG